MAISTKEELQFLLHRGIEIEKKFESFSALKGFVVFLSGGKNVELFYQTLNRLITDENRHVRMVQALSG